MKLSVVIPVHNGGEDLRTCLQALTNSTRAPDEIIVVDDVSEDSSALLAPNFGILVPSADKAPVGPAKCRNRGAAIAHGDILIFLDADVEVHRDTISTVESHFEEHPEIAALFGCYDTTPPHRSVVSLYKNLQHHFVHDHAQEDASTFWTGVGAIRRDVFIKLGGFAESYSRPSIEDIELGMRLKDAGHRIRLCKDVQATHLKRWNIVSLLRSDIFDRAIPWTQLILASSQLPSDLNLDYRSRLSALCVWALAIALPLGFWFHLLWIGALAIVGALIACNLELYRLFYRRGGPGFILGAIPLHFLYFFYSSLIFGILWIGHLFFKRTKNVGLLHGS